MKNLINNEDLTDGSIVEEVLPETVIYDKVVEMGWEVGDVQVIQSFSSITTRNVGPCHVICMYGLMDNQKRHMAMAHRPFQIAEGVKLCHKN